jgi:hypothetical protein
MSRIKGLLTRKMLFSFVLAVIVVGSLGVGYYYYHSYQNLLKNPDIVTTQEVATLQKEVGRLMVLPNETPSTATVLDKTKLSGQAFFANAENGDKILIYSTAKQAILYRPSTDKIVQVMPISLDTSASSSSGATTANIKVALLNGTNTDGLTSTAEVNIKNKIANVDVVSKTKAAKTNYTATTVVDISGTKADQAKAIADAVGGTVGSLPSGETAPAGADILVIVAK